MSISQPKPVPEHKPKPCRPPNPQALNPKTQGTNPKALDPNPVTQSPNTHLHPKAHPKPKHARTSCGPNSKMRLEAASAKRGINGGGADEDLAWG